jgi:Na+/proline symporter
MLAAVAIGIIIIMQALDVGFTDLPATIAGSDYSSMFEWNWKPPRNFFKQFFAGAFITIVMTGLDQDMMQKNLTCRNIGEAQKNMFWFSIILVFANLMFLSLGALLYIYAAANNIAIPADSDDLFPLLAINHFSILAGIMFVLGITAAAYSSADSALTALTTSFCVDFLNFDKREENQKKRIRIRVHVAFSMLIFLVIVVFKLINNQSVINSLFTAAGYTYGPLLGLYAFGMFTKLGVKDRWGAFGLYSGPAAFLCLRSKLKSIASRLRIWLRTAHSKWFLNFSWPFTYLKIALIHKDLYAL